ncbi:hypothetical protein HPP92_028367 [Vanilla planifolia]|uniref:Uncharacterized protein n=1 Tax=Vanilla planifolia TaxID=51239 RepID=A0A835P8B6_VANPL|nr:hypothetical protein HPP92_028367 [Vanilla planifolia]
MGNWVEDEAGISEVAIKHYQMLRLDSPVAENDSLLKSILSLAPFVAKGETWAWKYVFLPVGTTWAYLGEFDDYKGLDEQGSYAATIMESSNNYCVVCNWMSRHGVLKRPEAK